MYLFSMLCEESARNRDENQKTRVGYEKKK